MCDPGDVRDGKCDDCRLEEEEEREAREKRLIKMMRSPSEQMCLKWEGV